VTYTLPHVTDDRIITLEGEIGPGEVIALQRRIVRALDRGCGRGRGRIVVDLGAVTGVGGPTIGVLCGALRFVSRCGATLAIAGGPPGVRRGIELCEIDGVELCPSVNAALTDTHHNRRASVTTKGTRQHA
jgi:anti-anti-sigma regulatory factor